MMAGKLRVHAGLPKRASTSLQRQLFARQSEITYLAAPAKAGAGEWSETARKAIQWLCSGATDGEPAAVRALRDKAIAPALEEGTTVAISDDSLYRGDGATLARVFPEANILAVISDPESHCRSAYSQYLKGLGAL